MANYKVVDADELDAKFKAIADSIRGKTGKTELIPDDDIPSEIDSIPTGGGSGDELFNTYMNNEITNFVVSKEATKVRPYLFYKDTTIKTADLRNATNVGSEAFRDSTLEEVIFNDDFVAKGSCIGARVFYNTQLVDVNSTIEFYLYSSSPGLFSYCSKLKNVYLPNVFIYTSQIFYNCSALEKVVISGTSFGSQCFANCSSLTALVLVNETKATLTLANCFTGTPIANGTGYIYVPKALIEEYKVDTNWVTYSSQFRAIEDYPEICGGAE